MDSYIIKRNVIIVVLLNIVTFGLYGLYYTYQQAKALEYLGMLFGYRSIDRYIVLFFAIFFNVGKYLNIYSSSEYLLRKDLRA